MKNVISTILVVIIGLWCLGYSQAEINILPDDSYKTNWIIRGTFEINETTRDPLTGTLGRYGVMVNTIVATDGTLIIRNATLYFLKDVNKKNIGLTVNGKLIMEKASITVATSLLDPYPSLDVTIDGASEVKISDSILIFPGNFTIKNTNNIIIRNTTFRELETLPPSIADIDYFDDGPSVKIISSKVYMIKTSFLKIFEHEVRFPQYIGTLSKISPPGNIIVDSISDKIICDKTTSITGYENAPIHAINISLLVVGDSSYDGSSNIVLCYGGETVNVGLVPNYTVDTWVNFTGISVGGFGAILKDLTDGKMYLLATKTTSGKYTIKDVKIHVYIPDVYAKYGFDRFNFVLDASTLYGFDLHIDADYSADVEHNAILLRNGAVAHIANLTVDVAETPISSAKKPPYIISDPSSKIYIYRYAKVKVLDFFGNPINGVDVVATSINATDQSTINQLNSMMYSQGISVGAEIRNKTAGDMAILPLLSDILSLSSYPNSWYTGNYRYRAIDLGNTIGYANGSFVHFPYLSPETNQLVVEIQTSSIIPNVKIISISPGNPVIAGRVVTTTVYVSCENSNAGKVWVSLRVLSGTSSTVIGNKTVTLNIGPPLAVNFNWQVFLPKGNYSMIARIGTINVHESPTTDNILETKFTVYPDVDFAPDPGYFEYSPYPSVGSEVFVKFRIRNYGNQNSYTQVRVSISGPGYTAYEDMFYVSINANSYNETTIKFRTQSSGPHTVSVETLEFWDFDPTNNQYTFRFDVLEGSIDYFVKKIDAKIDSDIEEGYVKLKVTVEVGYVGINPVGVYVAIYDTLTQLELDKEFGDVVGNTIIVSLEALVPYSRTYSFMAIVDPDNLIKEFNEGNNSKSVVINTLTYIHVSVFSPSIVINGTVMNFTVTVLPYNTNLNNLVVNLILDTGHKFSAGKTSVAAGESTNILFSINMSADLGNIMGGQPIRNLRCEVTVTSTEFSPYYYKAGARMITVKERPDISIENVIVVETDGKNNDSVFAEGVPYKLLLSISNKGGTDPTDIVWQNTPEYKKITNASIMIKDLYKGTENIIFRGSVIIPRAGQTIETLIEKLPLLNSAGEHSLIVIIDDQNLIPEKGEGPGVSGDISNNYYKVVVKVTIPELRASISSVSAEGMEIKENQRRLPLGNEITILISIYNRNVSATTLYTGESVKTIKVNIYMGGKIIKTIDAGVVSGRAIVKYVPDRLGEIRIDAYYMRGADRVYLLHKTSPESIIGVTFSTSIIPGVPWFQWWMLLIIIIVIVIVAVIFVARSIYKKEAENLVECGVCHSLIPVDATKCPKCGTIFEVGKVRCGACGSWLDADAEQCSLCGAVYVEPTNVNYNLLMNLKKKYEAFLERFRSEARRELGDAYKEEEFFKWWQRHPEFISFEDWKKREAEREKIIRCPHCGNSNPITAEVCHVCGTPLKALTREIRVRREEEEEEAEMIPETPFFEEDKKLKKKVVKRVPKK